MPPGAGPDNRAEEAETTAIETEVADEAEGAPTNNNAGEDIPPRTQS